MRIRYLAVFATLSALVSPPSIVYANDQHPRFDQSKSGIEGPLKRIIRSGPIGSSNTSDVYGVQSSAPIASTPGIAPMETYSCPPLPAVSSKQSVFRESPSDTGSSGDARAGHKVAPGLVSWRKDFTDACQRAITSKKPVLLFQMMGKLDDEFC